MIIKRSNGLSIEMPVSAELDALENKNKSLVLGTSFGYRLPLNFSDIIATDADIQPVMELYNQLKNIGTKYISDVKNSLNAGAVNPPDFNYIDSVITETIKARDQITALLKQKYDIHTSGSSVGVYVAKENTAPVTNNNVSPVDAVANLIPDKNTADTVKKILPYALGGVVLYNLVKSPIIPLIAIGGFFLFQNMNKNKEVVS